MCRYSSLVICFPSMIRNRAKYICLLVSIVALNWHAMLPAFIDLPQKNSKAALHLGTHVFTGDQKACHKHGDREHKGTQHCLGTLSWDAYLMHSSGFSILDFQIISGTPEIKFDRRPLSADVRVDPPVPRI